MDDRWLKTPTMLRRMQLEADWGPYIACSTLDDGNVVFDRSGQPPEAPEQMFQIDMAIALNKHLGHDGRWVVMLTHPGAATPPVAQVEYKRFAFIWFDDDGDPQFTVENQQPWWKILSAPPDSWLEQAEEGWAYWYHFMRNVLEPDKERELYKKAQGQKPPSLTMH